MIQPIFGRRALAPLSSVVTEATAQMLRRWRAGASAGIAVDVERESIGVVLRILVKSLFGDDLGRETEAVIQAIATTHNYFETQSRALFRIPRSVPTPANLRFRRAFATLTDAFLRVVDERRRKPSQNHDLLGRLLEARDRNTGEGLTRRQLHDELLMLSLLGHKTTALALTWTLYLLSTAPAAEQRLYEELTNVLDGRSPTLDDLPRLIYTRQVIEESMRLYPPAWLIGRVALEDDEIGGYRLPARATVVLSPYLLHRHPEFWEEPEVFDPDRFSPERSGKRPRFVYLPFGEGGRTCVASSFAMMQLATILAEVVRACRLRLVPDHPVKPEVRVVLRPHRGLPMTVHPRQPGV
jgi:cytochrome P450